MQKMNFFQKLYASVVEIKNYPLLAAKGAGSAVVYLLLLTLTLGSISLIKPIVDYVGAVDIMSANFDKLRDFTFSSGELTMAGDMPYITETGGEAIIVDTTGKTGSEILNNYDNAILVTNQSMYQKSNGMQITETNFSGITGITFTKEDCAKFIPLLKFVSLFIFLFGWIGFFIGKLISGLFIALIGLIVASIQRVKLTFGTLYAIGLYSLTLPIIVSIIVKAANIKIPYFYLLYLAGAVVYLAFAVKAIKISREEGPISPDAPIPPDMPQPLV